VNGSFVSNYFNFEMVVDKIRAWWIWGYWISPLMYAMNALGINEFLGHKWRHVSQNIYSQKKE
jgi:ABC-type multidrug transport system permease subunit